MADSDSRKLDYQKSTFREKMLEHTFVAEVLQEIWFRYQETAEVLHSEIASETKEQTIHIRLAEKPGGCVVWMLFDEDRARGRACLSYLFFGGEPGEPLPSLAGFRVGRMSRGDATGHKPERPSTRVIPRRTFTGPMSLSALIEHLFGPMQPGS